MKHPALQVSGLTSGYKSSVVLRDLSLLVNTGEALALLGKNGMGKSTLLKSIMGFLPKRQGTLRLNGRDISRMAPHQICRAGLGYAAQEQALFADLSVRDNLALGLATDKVFDERFDPLASLFPVFKSRLKQYAGSLSGGEQKMLLVARTLMGRPSVILLDEVTEGLQPTVIQTIAAALKWEREQRGTAMLIVEQHVAFALDVSDRYLVLKQGEVVDEGSSRKPQASREIFQHLRV
jgi:ABC-type branched-subunit amino acid transport system ATPase component